MKSIIKFRFSPSLLIAMMILFGVNLKAQHGPGDGPPPIPNDKQIEKMVLDLSEELSLSNDQSDRIEALFKEHFEEVKESLDRNEKMMRGEMELKKSEFENKIKGLLSEEQAEQFEEFMKKLAPPRRQRR